MFDLNIKLNVLYKKIPTVRNMYYFKYKEQHFCDVKCFFFLV